MLLVALAAFVHGPAAWSAPANGEDAGASGKVRVFNIPAQPLRSALEAYSLVTGAQLIYDSHLAESRRSNAIVGLFAPETALRILLDGTDLTIRYTGPRDITLVPAFRRGVEEAAGQPHSDGTSSGALALDTLYVEVPAGAVSHPDFTSYGRMVGQEVRRALGKDPVTATRIYRVQLDVSVDEAGRLHDPLILHSSGIRKFDKEIRRVVESVVVKQLPPKDMPQPVRLTIIAI